MKTTLLKGLSCAGLALLLLSAVSSVHAQAPCPTCPQQCPTCPQHCNTGYCRTGCHDCCFDCCCFGCCCEHGCNDCCLHAIKKWALCWDYYILPPDYGWNVPTKVPVVRKGVTYDRYWPETWYGTGTARPGEYRSYPMVANPTDTTQLGYTYQQVPYWQPNHNRLPKPPVPSQWHVRETHRNLGYHGKYHSHVTPIHYHQPAPGVYMWAPPQQMPQAMPHAAPHMAPAPVSSDPVPPAPEPAVEPKKLEPQPPAPRLPTPTPAAPPADKKEEKTAEAPAGTPSAMLLRRRR